ncbi:MAG: GAF domain-containing protein [Bacteroidia bacterium]|nr:GAF domain-containing protein [Bacteroidia bacterium]
MAEALHISGSNKEEKYRSLLPQLEAMLRDTDNVVSAMAHVCACLKEAFNFFWVGYYIKSGEKLTVGPYQGPLACMQIGFGKGVCGTAWKENRTLIVPDVNKFPGHIACSALSKSEIVVPLYDVHGNFRGVLDVDSEYLGHFDQTDALYLGEINKLVGQYL